MKLTIKNIMAVFVFFAGSISVAADLPANFQFEGQLLDASNNPITVASSVTFEVYDPGTSCLLYKEMHPSVTPDANGNFAVMVGTGTRDTANDGGLPWADIYSNSKAFGARTNCASGYTPANGHGRKLYITVGATPLSPAFDISAVPMANVAQVANQLDGAAKIPNGMGLSFDDGGGKNTQLIGSSAIAANLTFKLPNTAGTAGQVLKTDGTGVMSWMTPASGLTDLTGEVTATGPGSAAATITAGAVTTAKLANSSVTYPKFQNVGAIKILGNSTGAPAIMEEISIGTGLTLAGSVLSATASSVTGSTLNNSQLWVGDAVNTAQPVTMSGDATLNNAGVLTLANSGVTPGTYQSVSVDSKGRVTAGSGLSLIEADIPTLAAAGKVSGSAITSGNIITTGSVSTPSVSANIHRYYDADSSNFVSLVSPSVLSADYSLTLPPDAGTSGQMLTTDGSGVLSWTSPSASGITDLTGDVTATGPGSAAATIQASAVTTTKMADANVTYAKLQDVSAPGKFLGRFDAGAGPVQELTIGSGLNLDASGNLTATGSGGTVTNVTINPPLSVTSSTTTPDLSISQANSVTDGYLSSTDWNTFNSKQSSSLSNAYFWMGNASNVATAVVMGGDATMTNTGALTISASSVNSSKIVDGSVATVDLAPSSVTYAKMQNISSTGKLLGRFNTGAGPVEEITIGSGLALDGSGNLTASGGGGSGDFMSDGSVAMTGDLNLNGFRISNGGPNGIYVDPNGKVAINNASPTASLMLPAGTVSPGSAPLKFIPSALMTTPEAGAVEFDGTSLYYTDNSNTRRTLSTGGGGGTAAGSNWAIQYNNSSALAGDSNFVWDSTNGRLGVGTNTPTVALDVIGDMNVSRMKINAIITPGAACSAGETNMIAKDSSSSSGLLICDGATFVKMMGPWNVSSGIYYVPTGNKYSFGAGVSGTASVMMKNSTGSVALPVARIEGGAGQTGDLLQVIDGAAASKLVINSSGRVGVGITAPAVHMDVAGAVKIGYDAAACAAMYAGAIRFNAGTMEFCDGTTAWKPISGGDIIKSGSPLMLGTMDANILKLKTNNIDRVTILDDGRVFMGMPANANSAQVNLSSSGSNAPLRIMPSSLPGTPADGEIVFEAGVNRLKYSSGGQWFNIGRAPNEVTKIAPGTAAAPGLAFETNMNTGMFNPASNDIAFSTAGTERIRINASGMVGIGTNTPSQMLDVNGGIRSNALIEAQDVNVINNMTVQNVTINQFLQLMPTGTPPAASQGAMAYNMNINAPCFHDGTMWVKMDGVTACGAW